MARIKSTTATSQKRLEFLESMLDTWEDSEMGHIEKIHFDKEGNPFYHAYELGGKLYSRLGEKLETYGNMKVPVPDAIPKCEIVKTLTRKEAIKMYEKELAELEKKLSVPA